VDDVVKAACIPGYQNMDYKVDPVWYSALYVYSATYIVPITLNILRVVAATVHSE